MMDSKNIKVFKGRIKEEKISKILHWGFGFFVLAMLSTGIYMTSTEFWLPLYNLHKSLGVVFSLLIGFRLYWSIRYPWQSSFVGNKYESLARRTTHGLLLGLLIVMPVSGLLSSGYSGWSVHVFDFVIIPVNFNSAGEVEPYDTGIYQMAKASHKVLAYTFVTLISLHIAAVLKHHFNDKDSILTKMLNSK